MVTPQISGLKNGDALAALAASGIVGVTGDNTWTFLRSPVSVHHMLLTTVANNGFAGWASMGPLWCTAPSHTLSPWALACQCNNALPVRGQAPFARFQLLSRGVLLSPPAHQQPPCLPHHRMKIVPREATEVYFNCTTTGQNFELYNRLYPGLVPNFDGILQREAARVAANMLRLRKDPHMMVGRGARGANVIGAV